MTGVQTCALPISIENGVIVKPALGEIQIHITKGEGPALIIPDKKVIEKILKDKEGKGVFYIPAITVPKKENKILSRFLGKVALEGLVYKAVDNKNWVEEIANKEDLDSLRNYVRYGRRIQLWPYHQRRLYKEDAEFLNKTYS